MPSRRPLFRRLAILLFFAFCVAMPFLDLWVPEQGLIGFGILFAAGVCWQLGDR